MIERKYAFRERLDQVHKPGRRDARAVCADGEIEITEDWCIVSAEELKRGAAAVDLQDYLQVSMGLSVLIRKEATGRQILLQEVAGDNGFDWEITPERIFIRGNIRRGVYYLEDLMNFREAPFLSPGTGRRDPLFAPRMVHSGWGLDQFPDRHLDAIAHAGFDTVLLFVKGVDLTTHGVYDFNDLIRRAADYGLGVYFYSYLNSWKHPDEPDAEEFFDREYGSVFRECPGAKGLILVGESCGYPSKDPRAGGRVLDGVRPRPGFFPADDYPQWLNAVKKAVRKYAPEVDVVFWTYNWGNEPADLRLPLIENLPQDVALEATYEMYSQRQFTNHTTPSPDYSITSPGPSFYFTSEAQAAHQRGLRLYSMTNTAGMTWDCGMIPYVPVPQQWFKRFRGMIEAHDKYGLSGIMDSHHYGWYPSPICECAKWSFWTNSPDMEEILDKIAVRDFGKDAAPKIIKGWQKWSDAISMYSPGFDDQAGPLRVGPAYPFILNPILYPHNEQKIQFPTTPQSTVGSRWLHAYYQPENVYNQTFCGRRIPEDIRIMTEALELWEEGNREMDEALKLVPAEKLEDAERQIGVGKFYSHALRTMIGTKRWWIANKRLEIEYDFEKAHALLDEMDAIAAEEEVNVKETIPLVENDSRLGWEPSMDYMADCEHLTWKLEQLRRLRTKILPAYRRTISTDFPLM